MESYLIYIKCFNFLRDRIYHNTIFKKKKKLFKHYNNAFSLAFIQYILYKYRNINISLYIFSHTYQLDTFYALIYVFLNIIRDLYIKKNRTLERENQCIT